MSPLAELPPYKLMNVNLSIQLILVNSFLIASMETSACLNTQKLTVNLVISAVELVVPISILKDIEDQL